MELATYVRAQAHNNAWANYRLLAACAQLTPEELLAGRTGFFPSIIHTLNHILIFDWFYVSGLEGASVGPGAFDPELPCPALSDLHREQSAVDRRLIALCQDLDPARLSATVDHLRDGWTQSEPVGRTLLHLFQHQIHHRGQVHAMLSSTDVAPPQLDEFFLGHERDQAPRREDFAALGFDEEAIWR